MAPLPRIVVADDSGLMRRVVANTLKRNGFDVVGEATDGDEALALCQRLAPDAMTLDLAMPGRDGISVLRELRTGSMKVPTVVVSAFNPRAGARAVDALAEGAFELVAKPAGGNGLSEFGEELTGKLRAAAGTAKPATAGGRVQSARTGASSARATVMARRRAAAPARSGAGSKLVMIACSTGGPKALAELMPALPSPLGAGTLIVQHMPPGFTHSLAARLDGVSGLTIKEATTGDLPSPTTALLAPGGSHLRLDGHRRAELSDAPEIGGLRPRGDLTIKDVAKLYGRKLVLVVLTGMGQDGLEGAREVRKQGGRILVEAASTCTVYGMPRAIADAGLADKVLPLHELPEAIVEEMTT
jgi:two-component system chemotaxis response regulator CheB